MRIGVTHLIGSCKIEDIALRMICPRHFNKRDVGLFELSRFSKIYWKKFLI